MQQNIIIMVGGKSHSGKGEFSKGLESILKNKDVNVIRCSLSTYIREITEKDFYCDDMESIQARKFMAEVYRLGTELYPYHMGRRVWERDIRSNLKETNNIIIVESFRELNNYIYFKELLDKKYISQIITVRIERPNFNVCDEELNSHVSETDLDNFPFDFNILNDRDTEELNKKAEKFLLTIIDAIKNENTKSEDLTVGNKVQITKILNPDKAEHLEDLINSEGYVFSWIIVDGEKRYKVITYKNGEELTSYFRRDELRVIEG